MLFRNVTTALLSILLLLGSVPPSLAGVAIGATDASGSETHCRGVDQVFAVDMELGPAKVPMNCSDPEGMNCLRIAAQCSLTPLYALTGTSSVPSIQPTTSFRAAPISAEYQSPIADVLTPPPDSTS